MSHSVRIDDALILTMTDGAEPFQGSVRFQDGIITHVGEDRPSADEIVDARGGVLLPGFIQTHIHLCQTLFRNLADDLKLLDWLKHRIWPLEAALDAADMRASADLGLLEIIRSGTTTILDMGSVRHTDEIGAAIESAGIRAFIGKTMMDHGNDVPNGLRESTDSSLRESDALCKRWHGAADGRIHYAYAPRFALSCTRDLLETVAGICQEQGLIFHTHCAETRDENALVRQQYGVSNLTYLHQCGATGPRSLFVHMVHLDESDMDLVSQTSTQVVHCPSSNLKLGSGFAPIPRYLERKIPVSLGADGAPCNNTLDMFMEMRLAALIHKPTFGPTAMDARTVLYLATRGGARALGIDHLVGSIEPGKHADLLFVRLDRPFNGVAGNPFSRLVYTANRENVVDAWCDGRRILQDGQVLTVDAGTALSNAQTAITRVLDRV